MTTADHASTQVIRIIQRAVPVKKNLAVGISRSHPGWAQGGIDLNPADSASVLITKLYPHAMVMISTTRTA